MNRLQLLARFGASCQGEARALARGSPVWQRLLGCTILALGSAGLAEDVKPPAVTVFQPLERVTAHCDFAGRLEPIETIEVRATASGTVNKVLVKPGTEIKKDTLLLEIDPGPLQEGVARAETAVQHHERELQQMQRSLEKAQKLAGTASRQALASELTRLRKSMQKARVRLQAALNREPLPKRRDRLKNLQAAVDQALAGPSPHNTLDSAYETDLLRLAQAIEATRLRAGAGQQVGNGPSLARELQALRRSIDRVVTLSRATSKVALDVLVARRDLAAENLKIAGTLLAAARLDLDSARVTAPSDGRVAAVGVKPGDRVSGGSRSATVLVTLARTKPVRVAFDLDESTFLHMRRHAQEGTTNAPGLAGVPVVLELRSETGVRGTADDTTPHRGVIAFVDNRVHATDGALRIQTLADGKLAEAKEGMVRIHALFPNDDGALTAALFAPEIDKPATRPAATARPAGIRARLVPAKNEPAPWVRLTLKKARRVLLVPDSAVLHDEAGHSFVGVVNDQDLVESRPVKTGGFLNGFRTIDEGLTAGDWVMMGTEDVKRDPADKDISPADFARGLKQLGVKPGATVRPVRTVLPDTGRSQRPDP